MPIEKSALRLLLDYLRHGAGVPGPLPSPCPSPVDELVCRYVDYLRKDRGLAENSILVYVPFVRDLLRDQVSRAGGLSVKAFDAATIRSFLLNHVRERSGEYRRLLATSLRSFFRFLFLCGDLTVDLSLSVPTVRKCQKAWHARLSLTRGNRPGRSQRRTSRQPLTRRDYAILLLLLARLGLRAGEIVTLELNDIRWRSGRNRHSRQRSRNRVPCRCPPMLAQPWLYTSVKIAVSREGRRVFRRGLRATCRIDGACSSRPRIVRLSLTRARGFQRSGRGAAHLFRHGFGCSDDSEGCVACRDLPGLETSLAKYDGDLCTGVL